MSFVLRAARADDLEPLYEMAKLTGGGFTNLPADRDAITAKLDRAAASFARTNETLGDDLFVLVLENAETGEVRGTCQLMTKIGARWPFYSYRLNALTQYSRELDRTVRAELLSLVTDLEGSSEVGGLFLHPAERAGGLGLLLARSRYLFIAMHRTRFADRVIAELRGIIDERGGSPFWDGVAGRFFGMSFQEADYFNAINGNQFIADLMPKHPVYVAMLSKTARSAIGLPHPHRPRGDADAGARGLRLYRLCRHLRRRADDGGRDRPGDERGGGSGCPRHRYRTRTRRKGHPCTRDACRFPCVLRRAGDRGRRAGDRRARGRPAGRQRAGAGLERGTLIAACANAFRYSPKIGPASLARMPTTWVHTATFWRNCAGSILSSVSSGV